MSVPRNDDCQVCLLTSPGRGAVATVALTGPHAAILLSRFFHPTTRARDGSFPGELALARIYHGRWHADGEEIVVCRSAPSDFEIHCHGGVAAAARLLDDLAAAGARVIPWREWVAGQTSGAIERDALTALPAASTQRTAGILLDQYRGALSRAVQEILADLAAADHASADRRLQALLAREQAGLHLTDPFRVVLAGGPNVGKSSLINALLGYQRTIVFDAPGTTRDVVSAHTAIDGWPVMLSDTAGLRRGADPIEQAGVRLAREAVDRSDLVVLVRDVTAPGANADEPRAAELSALILVENKCDLVPPLPAIENEGTVRTSAVTGQGMGDLLREIGRRLVADPPPAGAAVPFTPAQFGILRDAQAALAGREPKIAIELLASLVSTGVPHC